MKNKIIFITGPTASGKSDLSLWLAKKIEAHIINADSRQVYQFLDIGSGKIEFSYQKNLFISGKKFKVSYSLKNQIAHYLISQYHPRFNYSLGKWLQDSYLLIDYLLKKEKRIIFCGGTLLYLKALTEGWQLPQVAPNYQLRKRLEKLSNQELFSYLSTLDKNYAERVDKNNKRRLIRAIEIVINKGYVPFLEKKPRFNFLIIAPWVEWSYLEKKIKKRLLKRALGIIKEIINLRYKVGLSFERIISFGLEYQWFGLLVKTLNIKKITDQDFLLLKKDDYYQTILNKCYRRIRRFARKQLRELNKIQNLFWVKDKNNCLEIVKKSLDL